MAKRKLPKGIRIKGGTYEARCTIRGKVIAVYGKDLDDVIARFEEAKARALDEENYKKNNITLNEWFDEWFDSVKSQYVKETSIPPMKNSYYRTFGFYLGNELLKGIRPMDVQQAMNAMREAGIAVRSIRDALGRLRECMEFAVANRLIPANPCVVIEVPWEDKVSKKEIALTQDEQNAILHNVRDSWYKEAFYFMFLTGVRVGELGGLTWDDVDFKNKVVRIRHSLACQYCNGEKIEKLTTPKTVNSYRTIPFIGEMEEILRSQRTKWLKKKAELGKRWREKLGLENVVFVTSMGSPCNRYIMEKECTRVYKSLVEDEAVAAVLEKREPAEIRKFHPHTLRHTFATRCFEKGLEPKVVQELMGHSSISVTLNIYTHVMKDKMMEEVYKMGNANTITQLNNVIQMPDITAMSHA